MCDVWGRSEEFSHIYLHLFMKFKIAVIEQDITLNHCGYMILHKLEFYKLPKGVILFLPQKGKIEDYKAIDDNQINVPNAPHTSCGCNFYSF